MRFNLFALTLIGLMFACPDEKNCLMCFNNTCAICENSFLDDKTKKCNSNVTPLIDHCKAYTKVNDIFLCQMCEFCFVQNETLKTCDKCAVENCAGCDSHGRCVTCFDKILIDFQKNSCNTQNKCSLQHCNFCTGLKGKEHCLLCENGFAPSTSMSGECVAAPQNCWALNPTKPDFCFLCTFGYYLTSSGTCLADSSGIVTATATATRKSIKQIHFGEHFDLPLFWAFGLEGFGRQSNNIKQAVDRGV